MPPMQTMGMQKAVARLADKKTMVQIEELLTAEITVLDSKGVGHTKTVPLLVLQSHNQGH